MIWTTEIISHAMNLRAHGSSYDQIARQIGTSRNAVIGKLWRVDNRRTTNSGMGRPLGLGDTWDTKTFETYAQRKERLANEARNKTANANA